MVDNPAVAHTNTMLRTMLIVGVFALCGSAAHAVEPKYLNDFPDPERVAKDYAQGGDRSDTLARQVAALDRVWQIAGEMAGERKNRSGPDRFPNADELALRVRIATVVQRLKTEAGGTVEWMAAVRKYESRPELAPELLRAYFPPEFQKSYAAMTGAVPSRGVTSSRWAQLTEADRSNAALIGGVSLLLLVLALGLGLRAPRGAPSDTAQLKDGGYDWATGTLTDYVFTQDEQKAATVHENFVLAYDGGRHPVELTYTRSAQSEPANPYFKNAQDHRVTALWRRSRSGDAGGYVAFKDWTLQTRIEHPVIAQARLRSLAFLWTFIPALVLGYLVGHATDLVPFLDGKPRTLLMTSSFGAAWVGIQFAIGTIERSRSEKRLDAILALIGSNDAAPARQEN